MERMEQLSRPASTTCASLGPCAELNDIQIEIVGGKADAQSTVLRSLSTLPPFPGTSSQAS